MTERFLVLANAIPRCSAIRYLFSLMVLISCSVASAEDPKNYPDGRSLLEGVEAARLAIPPSRMKLRTEFMGSNYTFNADFENEKRRFWIVSNDRVKERLILTGTTVTYFDGLSSVTFHDVNRPNSCLFFDPRLLGITSHYSWNDTLAKELPYRDGIDLKTIGAEEVNGKTCWHVSVVDKYKQRRDFWIDDKNGFRVYRSEFSLSGPTSHSTTSWYSDDDPQSLPSRVITQYFDEDGNALPSRKLFVMEVESDVAHSDDTWSYSSLDLPIGVPVTDIRSKRRLGYWSGFGIVLDVPRVSR